MIRITLLLACTATLAACPKKGGDATSTTTTASTGGGEAAPDAAKPFGDTMADAPLHHLGANLKAAAGCNSSGYAKFDFPVGQSVKMTVTAEGPPETCLSVSYLKANGGNVDGMMKVLCVDKNASETWDVQGLEGGSFIQMSEQPPCKNANITIAVSQ
jgi:hypothetical protein